MKGDIYGLHRVIEPKGVLPQPALRVDNDFSTVYDNEILVDVSMLNIDSASYHQIKEECASDAEKMKEKIMEIVAQRGKMQNPVTGSGGMLIGTIKKIGESLKDICLEISERYEINFVEISYEPDHVHFLVQSVPSMSLSEIVRKLKSITAKQLFRRHPEIKAKLWGGNFWTSGYYANTVGQYGNEEVIRRYIENQGKEKENKYKKVYDGQLTLF
jgi:putative transposase